MIRSTATLTGSERRSHVSEAPILVTGATGNVGVEVARQLLAMGVRVRAAGRDPVGSDRYPTGAEIMPLDFDQRGTFAKAVRGVERVFLMRPPAISDTKRYIDPFIDICRAAGVKQIVFLSLLGAERMSFVPHAKIEAHLRDSTMEWTMLRASFFMQNLSTTHRAEIRDQDEIIVPAGCGKTSFIDVRDIAAVAVKALTEPGHGGKAYTLTGAEALDYDEVAATLSEVLGRQIRYTNPSLLAFLRYQLGHGTPLGMAAVMAGIYTTTRFGLGAQMTDEVQRLLGRPPISFRQFAEVNREVWLPDNSATASNRDTRSNTMTQSANTTTSQQQTPPQRREPPKALFAVLNPIMKTTIRSPLHGAFSKSLMTMTVTGRKSGRRYVIPIGYTQIGDTIYCGTKGGWYKNLRGGAPVMLRLRGRDVPATGRIIEDQEGLIEAYRTFLPKAPHYAGILGVRVDEHGEPNAEDVTSARADGHVVIEITPNK
ncbi:MAG TPA: NmrA family NAD(P)-binding protein [Ktedonobacterales bacterium]|nr:NmrA family NAD(P)-binding protein [Ktedonobacterales bacterium]